MLSKQINGYKMFTAFSTFKKHTILNFVLLLGLIFSGFSPVAAQGQPEGTDHISVFFVVDDSGSMKSNDPGNLRITAVKLFITMLDPGDGAGVVTFSDESEIRAPYKTIQGYSDKVDLINSIGSARSEGYTNIKAAFQDVKNVIQQDQSGNRQIIIFLTDGKPELPNGLPAKYEAETLDLIHQLRVSVLAIGLTSGGLTSFLGQVPKVAEEGSQIIPAKTATDLLDVYLGILGQLKDRTIIGEGTIKLPENAQLAIDPSLVQYIDSVSFIAIMPPGSQATLKSPNGDLLSAKENFFSETFVDFDPNFSVLTISSPPGGDWQMVFQGSGVGQARAILRSRLRVKLVEPGYFAPAGEALPIVANLFLDDGINPPIKSIGDATFSVLIEGPDGLRESIDLLYDDGTHGDSKASDGDFTNLFVNTDNPGAYTITLTGRKGVVPVSTRSQVEVIKFPQVVIDEPRNQIYEIRTNTVPLHIHLDYVDKNAEYEGGFIASIESPTGNVTEIILDKTEGGFSGEYIPLENGVHNVEYIPVDGFFQGQIYTYNAETSFEAVIVANLIVKEVSLGLGESAGRQKFEVYEAKQGIPISIMVESKSDQPHQVLVRLDQMPGFRLVEQEPFTIAPLSQTSLTLHLISDSQIELGMYRGRLVTTPTGSLDILNNQSEINLEVYQPTIAATMETMSVVSDESCLTWAPIRLLINLSSSSAGIEKLNLNLSGIDGVKLDQDKIEVLPGQSQVEVKIVPEDTFSTGDYRGQLMLDVREGVLLQPEPIHEIAFQVDPVWISCQKPLIILGVGFILLVIVITGLIVKRVKSNMPAMVTGDLRYWLEDTPSDEVVEDLTALKQIEVTIGKGSECTISLSGDRDLEDIHARIMPEKIEGEETRMNLHPLGAVYIGNRKITSSVQLEEGKEYKFGKYVVVYKKDPI